MALSFFRANLPAVPYFDGIPEKLGTGSLPVKLMMAFTRKVGYWKHTRKVDDGIQEKFDTG